MADMVEAGVDEEPDDRAGEGSQVVIEEIDERPAGSPPEGAEEVDPAGNEEFGGEGHERAGLTRLYEWVGRRDAVRWTLGAMVVAWGLLFTWLGWVRHAHFGTFGFDLGIYDQGVWLLSRFKDPFVTIRGLNLFGHHMNVALLAFVPFYWVGGGPIFLLVAQVASQASGAVAVYLLARDRFEGARWPAVAMGAVLLLHPGYQWFVWEYFHPEVLAMAPLMFAYWAARAGRWKWFTVAALVAVSCKEDVALSMAVIGMLIALRWHRRIGAIVVAAATAWFFLATKALIPLFNGIGPFYDSFFGEFGHGPFEVAANVAVHPDRALEVATQPDRMSYYRMMFAPLAFLPFSSLSTFTIAVPMLVVNVLSTFPYQREYKYHWSALVLAGSILATVEAVAILGRNNPTKRAFFIGLVAATSLAGTVAWGASPISVNYHTGVWPLGADSRRPAKEAAVELVPPRAPASVIYYLAPHMTHREKIYEFPAPWKPTNWGVKGENLDDPAGVKWLAVDRQLLSAEDKGILGKLMADGEFVIRSERDGIVVAQRMRPPLPASPATRP